MRIWIDLGNSPHIPFFSALGDVLLAEGHELLWTAREYAQTVPLAKQAGLDFQVIGSHGGGNILSKGYRYFTRVASLIRWAWGKKIDLALSHNSHEPLLAARLLGITIVNLMDYEHHPANHLSFRLAHRVFVPESFPDDALARFGAKEKTEKYPGIKEDVYLAGIDLSAGLPESISDLGVKEEDILVVMRPPATEALYHRGTSGALFFEVLDFLKTIEHVKLVVLPRSERQERLLATAGQSENLIIPADVIPTIELLPAADLVVSGGGTMNREAAAIGVPAYTVFSGEMAAVDDQLVKEGRLVVLKSAEDLTRAQIRKKDRGPRTVSNAQLGRDLARRITSLV